MRWEEKTGLHFLFYGNRNTGQWVLFRRYITGSAAREKNGTVVLGDCRNLIKMVQNFSCEIEVLCRHESEMSVRRRPIGFACLIDWHALYSIICPTVCDAGICRLILKRTGGCNRTKRFKRNSSWLIKLFEINYFPCSLDIFHVLLCACMCVRTFVRV